MARCSLSLFLFLSAIRCASDRLRFALSLGAVILAAGLVTGVGRSTLHSERNFFGVLRVTGDQDLNLHSFLHGSTVHGRQSIVPIDVVNHFLTIIAKGRSERSLPNLQTTRCDGAKVGHHWIGNGRNRQLRTAWRALDLLRDQSRSRVCCTITASTSVISVTVPQHRST